MVDSWQCCFAPLLKNSEWVKGAARAAQGTGSAPGRTQQVHRPELAVNVDGAAIEVAPAAQV
jgi:hypothetical protein